MGVLAALLVLASTGGCATTSGDASNAKHPNAATSSATPNTPPSSVTSATPNADPTASAAGKNAPPEESADLADLARRARLAAKATSSEKPVSFTLGTMNLLGSQHTGDPGDDYPSWPRASWRTPQQAKAILLSGTDIVGLQETKPDQLDGLLARTGYEAYPGYQFGRRDTDNSILYDPKKFEFVSGTSFRITFMNANRPQTVLRLRHKATGREMYFLNVHTSAGRDREHTRTRHAGLASTVNQIRNLRAEGLPIFLTGDMNDRGPFRSRVLGPGQLVAAIDGPWRTPRFGPGWLAVDWLASTKEVSWTDFSVTNFQQRRISDHYFITARATVPAG